MHQQHNPGKAAPDAGRVPRASLQTGAGEVPTEKQVDQRLFVEEFLKGCFISRRQYVNDRHAASR
jgi:hypothetical protein